MTKVIYHKGHIMIDFNLPPCGGNGIEYISEAVRFGKICGDGPFTKKCSSWIKERFSARHAYLTTSCTHALEMSAILLNIKEGDEVILPSYTFCSTADAFVQRGAKLIFTDIRPDTMNIDSSLIEDAVTEKTKAISVVHYAGVACEMDQIMKIAKDHGLYVIEDAAQAFGSTYNGKYLGTIGDIGCFSFHETKNFSMGEGGAILFNDDKYRDKCEILREKGTDRSRFFRGEIDKYTWQDYGSSYLPSDILAAYLYAQLEEYEKIFSDRMAVWNRYDEALKPLKEKGLIETPYIPENCSHNAHMYYIKTKDLKTRTALIDKLKDSGVMGVFHYIPLHSSPAGQKYGIFRGEDRYTTKESERILRLPLYYGITDDQADKVIETIGSFFDGGIK